MRNPENPRSLGPVMTSLPDLPPIVDSILDSLWEDNTTLSSCSLVCRQWLNPSRRRLFHTIRIAKHADQLAGFLDLLLSSFTPRDHIQRLIIAPAIYAYPEEDIPLWDLIYVILTKLHNLTALTLQYIPLCQWTPDFFPRTIKLKRLFIGSLVTSQFLERELRSFLGLYAGVDELCVGTIRRGRSISTMYPPITNSFRLPVRKLTVEEPHVLPALRNILCPQTIRSLSVRLGRWATATHSDVIFHTNTFLEVVGPSLRHLDIRPTPFSIPALSWPWNELGVSYCTELESLVFYISISTRSEYQPYSWRHLVVLHDISAPLQKIHIRFQIVGDPEDIPTALASVNWEQLDRLLSRYHQTLERVDFEMSYERMKAHQLQRECEIVRNSLPQLVSLGCLHFV